MKYYRKFCTDEIPCEISKEEAKRFLNSYTYKKSFVDELFEADKSFRLKTQYSEIWTKTDDGLVPMPGFYGVCG